MKKIVSIIGICILIFTLCSCKEDHSYQIIEDEYQLSEDNGLSEEMQKEIIRAQAKLYQKPTSNYFIYKFYGSYDDAYVIGTSNSIVEDSSNIKLNYGSGLDISIPDHISVYVYRQGYFYSINQAYEYKILTLDHIKLLFRTIKEIGYYDSDGFQRLLGVDVDIQKKIRVALSRYYDQYVHIMIFSKNYGTYNGAIVFSKYMSAGEIVEETIKVEDIEFSYSSFSDVYTIDVYYNDQIYSLQEAYDNNILTMEDLLEIKSEFDRQGI